MKKCDVLIYTHEYPPFCGGVGEYMYHVTGKIREGLNCRILTTHYNNLDFQNVEDAETIIRFKVNISSRLEYLAGFFNLLFCLIKLGYPPVVAGCTISQRVCFILSHFVKFDYIVIGHGSEINWNNRKGKNLFRNLYKRSLHIFANSRYTSDLLKSYDESLEPDILYPGIDRKDFSEAVNEKSCSEVVEKYSIDREKFLILSLSRLDKRKGHDKILEALAQLEKKILDKIVYIIAGGGRETDNLRDQVKRLNLEKTVKLIGYLDDLHKIPALDLCDLFILMSREDKGAVEGYGISYLEAGARGKAVIGGNHGGTKEAVDHGETGMLVDPLDPAAIARTIMELFINDDMRHRMGNCARDRVLSEKHWGISQDKIFEYIEALGK